MSRKEKKRNRKLQGAIYFLLITWSLLLILLIFIFILKLNGYDTFRDWWNVKQEEGHHPQPTPSPDGHLVSTITPAGTPAPTEALSPEVTLPPDNSQSVTPQPTQPEKTWKGTEEILHELEERYGATVKEYGQVDTEYYVEGNRTMIFALPKTGNIEIDTAIREDIAETLKEAEEHLTALEGESFAGTTTLALDYDCFRNENWLSVVFHVTEQITGEHGTGEQEEIKTRLFPLVYSMETGERVSGQEMFHETYFAVLKERLMSEVVKYIKTEEVPETGEAEPTKGAEETAEPFLSYATKYRPEDYSLYYIKGDNVVFCFPENTLTEKTAHKEFTYQTDLSEALAFMKYNLSGKSTAREIRELDPNKKMIALTFDDGVHSPVEEQLLTILAEYDAKATFFTLGERTFGSRGDTLRDLYDAGHEIASHTYSHKYLTRETQETFWQEINNANLQIAKVVGHAPEYVRLPGGDYPDWSGDAPMPLLHWSLDSRDWKSRNADAVYKKVLSEVKDGDIILLHSLYQSTADAVEKLLPELAARGYQFVTVSELFYYKGITPKCGIRYKNGD